MQWLICVKGHVDEPRMIVGKTYEFAHNYKCQCKREFIMVEGITFTTENRMGTCVACGHTAQLPSQLRGLPPDSFVPLNRPGIDLESMQDDLPRRKEVQHCPG